MAQVLDNVSLGLIGGGAFLALAPGTVAPGNERVARLLGLGIALAGALRALAAARDEAGKVAAVIGAPIALAEKVGEAASVTLDALERQAAGGLLTVVGPPAPPPVETVGPPPPPGELVAPNTQAREPYLTVDVGITAGALTAPVSAVLISPTNGGELDISPLDRAFRGVVELRNYTSSTTDPLLEYVATIIPRSPLFKKRTVRGRILDGAGKKPKPLAPGEVRRMNGSPFDIGSRDVVDVDVILSLLVNGVQTQSTSFVLT